MTATPPHPRNVIDWYTDAITVLEKYRDRAQQHPGPIDGGKLLEGVRLAKQIVKLDEQ